MQESERKALKERHRYSEWAGRSTAPSDRSVRNFMFTGDELPGYRLDRVDRGETPQLVRVTGFWRRANTTSAVVRVDVFECATLNAAHEYLIDALNEFESGAFGRRTDVGFGDVAFGTDSVALFARGNLVVLVRKATPQTEAVTGIAQAIDAIIFRRLQEGST
jgi:hypothetical protein